jgi:hypothetical protein
MGGLRRSTAFAAAYTSSASTAVSNTIQTASWLVHPWFLSRMWKSLQATEYRKSVPDYLLIAAHKWACRTSDNLMWPWTSGGISAVTAPHVAVLERPFGGTIEASHASSCSSGRCSWQSAVCTWPPPRHFRRTGTRARERRRHSGSVMYGQGPHSCCCVPAESSAANVGVDWDSFNPQSVRATTEGPQPRQHRGRDPH